MIFLFFLISPSLSNILLALLLLYYPLLFASHMSKLKERAHSVLLLATAKPEEKRFNI